MVGRLAQPNAALLWLGHSSRCTSRIVPRPSGAVPPQLQLSKNASAALKTQPLNDDEGSADNQPTSAAALTRKLMPKLRPRPHLLHDSPSQPASVTTFRAPTPAGTRVAPCDLGQKDGGVQQTDIAVSTTSRKQQYARVGSAPANHPPTGSQAQDGVRDDSVQLQDDAQEGSLSGSFASTQMEKLGVPSAVSSTRGAAAQVGTIPVPVSKQQPPRMSEVGSFVREDARLLPRVLALNVLKPDGQAQLLQLIKPAAAEAMAAGSNMGEKLQAGPAGMVLYDALTDCLAATDSWGPPVVKPAALKAFVQQLEGDTQAVAKEYLRLAMDDLSRLRKTTAILLPSQGAKILAELIEGKAPAAFSKVNPQLVLFWTAAVIDHKEQVMRDRLPACLAYDAFMAQHYGTEHETAVDSAKLAAQLIAIYAITGRPVLAEGLSIAEAQADAAYSLSTTDQAMSAAASLLEFPNAAGFASRVARWTQTAAEAMLPMAKAEALANAEGALIAQVANFRFVTPDMQYWHTS